MSSFKEKEKTLLVWYHTSSTLLFFQLRHLLKSTLPSLLQRHYTLHVELNTPVCVDSSVHVHINAVSDLGSDSLQFPQQRWSVWINNIIFILLALSFCQCTAVCCWQLTLLIGRHHQAGILVLQPFGDKRRLDSQKGLLWCYPWLQCLISTHVSHLLFFFQK